MSIPANIPQVLARPLGPRGSRGMVGSSDPAIELTPVAAAVQLTQRSRARKRLKDLAEGSYAYFADEPGHELASYSIAGNYDGDS